MKVRLDKETVLRLFCACREAERSVHRALSAPWSDFLAYYGPDKRAATEGLVRRLPACATPPPPNALPSPSILKFALSYVFGRWRASWNFDARVICYLASTLERLLRTLTSAVAPERSELIALRMALHSSQLLLERHCPGLPEWRLARQIDHFQRTEWLPVVTLDEVLKTNA